MSPEGPMTKWSNPTSDTQRLHFPVSEARLATRFTAGGDEIHRAYPATFVDFEIPPGATVEIPSLYDSAIHRRDAAGTVTAGMAPLLIKEGQDYGVASCLIPQREHSPQTVAIGDLSRRLREASAAPASAADPEADRMAAARARRGAK